MSESNMVNTLSRLKRKHVEAPGVHAYQRLKRERWTFAVFLDNEVVDGPSIWMCMDSTPTE